MKYNIVKLWFLLSICLFLYSINVVAHDSQKEHDEDLKWVLFGNKMCTLPYKEDRLRFKAIADATALCVDQFSVNKTAHSKEKDFNDLKERIKIDMTFSDIDLCEGLNGTSVTANTHRRYTHLGWDHEYYPLPEFWKKRKKLLIDTVHQELFDTPDIPIISDIPVVSEWFMNDDPDERCEAFCELLYCIHILGDHDEADKFNKVSALEPLVRKNDEKEPGLIRDLMNSCEILFSDQMDSYTYPLFEQKMEKEYNAAKALIGSTGGVNTDKEFDDYKECVTEIFKTMANYIPGFLKKESYFKDAFHMS